VIATPVVNHYNCNMTKAARKLLDEILALPEKERLDIASEIMASVDGASDADWDAAWLAELEHRREAAAQRKEAAPSWDEVRARVLSQLGARPLGACEA